MNNKITKQDILNMVDIINYSCGIKDDEFDKNIEEINNLNFQNSITNKKMNDLFLNLEQICCSHFFKTSYVKSFPPHEKLISYTEHKKLEKIFVKLIFENLFIELDKDIDSIEIVFNEDTYNEDIFHPKYDINSIPTFIEKIYNNNNSIDKYSQWLDQKIKLITLKFLAYITVSISKYIIESNKNNDQLLIINNKLFNNKIPKAIKLLNLLVYYQLNIVLNKFKNYIQFKSYLDDMNIFFKSLDDDMFKIDFLMLRKIGKENYEKNMPKKNKSLEKYDEKVIWIKFKEFFNKIDFYFVSKEIDKQELFKIFKDMFYINIGWVYKNEEILFKKYISNLNDQYSHINSLDAFNEINLEIEPWENINRRYFKDCNIQTIDVWQQEYYNKQFDINKYKQQIEDIISNKLKYAIISVFDKYKIKYDLQQLNFDFIYSRYNKSIWYPVLLTFGEYYDKIKDIEEWKDKFIYYFVYENEMINFRKNDRQQKVIILDSYNTENFNSNIKKILSNYLDDSIINKIDPFIFVENNLLSAKSRFQFARYEYYGDLLYKAIITILKLKAEINPLGIDYFSSNFQNKLAKGIKIDKLIQSNNLFFSNENKNHFELADYLEALLQNIFIISGFKAAYDFIDKLIKTFSPECLLDKKNEEYRIPKLEFIPIKNLNTFFNVSKTHSIFSHCCIFNDPGKEIKKLSKILFRCLIKIYLQDEKIFQRDVYDPINLTKIESDISDYYMTLYTRPIFQFGMNSFNMENDNLFWLQIVELSITDFNKLEDTINNLIQVVNEQKI